MLSSFRNLPLVYKMLSMPLLAGVGFVIVLLVNLTATSSYQQISTDIEQGHVAELELFYDLDGKLELISRAFNEAVAASDLAAVDDCAANRQDFVSRLQEAREASLRTLDFDEVARIENEFNTYFDLAVQVSRRMITANLAAEPHGVELNNTARRMGEALTVLSNSIESSIIEEREDMGKAFGRARDAQSSARWWMILVTVVVIAGIVGISMFVARYITSSLGQIAWLADRMADGDFTERLVMEQGDELGKTVGALDRLYLAVRAVIETVVDSARTLAHSAEELTGLSTEMSSNAEETSMQANASSASAEQVNANIQTVAVAVEQMTASVKEIASNANRAAEIARSAVDVATSANSTVTQLGASSGEIGKVINVITQIAEQTNLLALNATIEAARAGEAGKGFAVVANEVKELARATADATEDIRRRIGAIQNDSGKAIEAIAEIGTIIEQINEFQTTIATAVEEQTATTSEISRNVAEAAVGSKEIAGNIGGVAVAAQGTTEGASRTLHSATSLSQMAVELQTTVSRFSFEAV